MTVKFFVFFVLILYCYFMSVETHGMLLISVFLNSTALCIHLIVCYHVLCEH